MPSHPTAVELYRSLLCEARRLPHPHLRDFWRLRIQGAFRANQRLKDPHIVQRKLARARKELKVLRRANTGYDEPAFERVLDHAYGRRGVLKQELLKPLLAAADPLPPIVPNVPNSSPPASTPVFDALVASSAGRPSRHKAIKSDALNWPPNLPVRDAEALAVFGSVPKRREVNSRKKYFRGQKESIYPPLELNDLTPKHEADAVQVDDADDKTDDAQNKTDGPKDVLRLPFQGVGLEQEILKLAGLEWVHKPWSPDGSGELETNSDVQRMPTRFLRRRYAALLRRVPNLSMRIDKAGNMRYDVAIPKGAVGADATKPLPFASKAHIAWWWGLQDVNEEQSDGDALADAPTHEEIAHKTPEQPSTATTG